VEARDRPRARIAFDLEGRSERAARSQVPIEAARESRLGLAPLHGERGERERSA
jgi:hypothetical protein